MKPGDLVSPVIPANHHNPRVRFYDIPFHNLFEQRYQKLIGKMGEHDVGLVLEMEGLDGIVMVKVLCNGITGWLDERLLKECNETG